MARQRGPEQAQRVWYYTSGPKRGKEILPAGTPVPLYADVQCSLPADVRGLDGSVIAGTIPTVFIGDTLEVPEFLFPDVVNPKVYTRLLGGPVIELSPNSDVRFDALEAALAALQPGGAAEAAAAADLTAEVSARGGADNAISALLAAQVVLLPAATGTDDTAAINTVLAASAGRVVKGRPGSSYLTTAPLIIKSGTMLDMTGCSVTLKTGSNCRMLQNAALTAARSISGCSTTAASTTLTGPASSFTAGDVGKAVRIWYPDGQYLDTTVATYTSGTQITLSVTVEYTMAACLVCVGPRDSDITVAGGNWVRLLNGLPPLTGPGDTTLHSMVFRRVDGLTVRPATFATTGGKYAISLADCSQFRVGDVRFLDTSSDGVHLNGGCFQGVIERCTGRTKDDMVGITPNDTAGGFGWSSDVDGPISGITVRDCASAMDATEDSFTVSVYGDLSATYELSQVLVSRCSSPARFYARAVQVSNGGSGVTVEETLGKVQVNGYSGNVNQHRGLKVRNTRLSKVAGGGDAAVQISDAAIVDLDIDGVVAEGSGCYPVTATTSTVTGQLRVRNVALIRNDSVAVIYAFGSGTSIAHLVVENCYRDGVDYTAARLINADTSADIDRVTVVACVARRCLYAVNVIGTGALPIHVVGSRLEGSTVAIRVSTATARIWVSSTEYGGGVQAVSGATIASSEIGLRCDVSALTQTVNDMAYNTNPGLGCGVGPVISNGTLWKHLYTGATS